MRAVKITLTMNVTFSKDDGSDITPAELSQLRANVDYLPQHAASIGALTDDALECVVDNFDYHTSVEEVAIHDKEK